jgi:hypothetical protein
MLKTWGTPGFENRPTIVGQSRPRFPAPPGCRHFKWLRKAVEFFAAPFNNLAFFLLNRFREIILIERPAAIYCAMCG